MSTGSQPKEQIAACPLCVLPRKPQRPIPGDAKHATGRAATASAPTILIPVCLVDNSGSSRRANDNYGFALAAQPGKSQGRPTSSSGSQPITSDGLPSHLLQGSPPSRSAEATTTTGRLPTRSFMPVARSRPKSSPSAVRPRGQEGIHKDREERLNLPPSLRTCAIPMTVPSDESATRLNAPGAVSARHVRCSSTA
jgi:hypothetical protein